MKTFIALTFIGILTCAFAKIVTIKQCENPKPMDGFEASKFFSGASDGERTWYVTHVKNESSASVCQTFTTSQDGQMSIVEYTFKQGKNDITIRCEAQPEEEKKLTFTCKNGGKMIFQAIFTVMETDYQDYALFYRCVTFKTDTSDAKAGDIADNYLVVRGTAGQHEIPGQLKTLTDPLKLKNCRKTT
uniref:Salivary lipocalin n=1 Tax=Dipetalogaster maximus TaxID=72496 RepID=G3CJR8_DIPMA